MGGLPLSSANIAERASLNQSLSKQMVAIVLRETDARPALVSSTRYEQHLKLNTQYHHQETVPYVEPIPRTGC